MEKTKPTLRANIEYGTKLLETETDRFKEEAISRFTDYDAMMTPLNGVSADNNYYIIAYPVIITTLKGEERMAEKLKKEQENQAKDMMEKLTNAVGGAL